MTESQILAGILQALGHRRDLCLVWRNNSGSARAIHAPNRVIAFGLPGSPDILGILRGGRWLGIEVKAAKGRQSEQQKRFQRAAEALGGVYVLARSVEEAVAAVERAAGAAA